jgi:hypothetical protein
MPSTPRADLTLRQLEAFLDADCRYFRAAQRGTSAPEVGSQLSRHAQEVRRALAKVPGMPALVVLVKGHDALNAGDILTLEEVRQVRSVLREPEASDVRRILFPDLWPLAIEDLTLPDAAGVLDKVQGQRAMRRPEFQQALAHGLADSRDWEERLSPEGAMRNYRDWVADVLVDLPQLGTSPQLGDEQPTGEPVPPDGPVPPNLFRWEGVLHRVRPRDWQLLNAIYPSESIELQVVVEAVWGAEGHEPKDTTIRSAIHRLNTRLFEIGVPFTYAVAVGRIVTSR